MPHSIQLRLKSFAAAHRLAKGYPKACRYLHGHNYAVQVTLTTKSETLNQYDFVLDFSDIKSLFNDWVQSHWDHVTIVCEEDKALLTFLNEGNQPHFIMPKGYNTSVERLAEVLFKELSQALNDREGNNASNISLSSVEISETENSGAIFSNG